MRHRQRSFHARLLGGAAGIALVLAGGAASAAGINIAPQSLDTALNELGVQGGQQVLIRSDVATGKVTAGVSNAPNFEAALSAMLAGTGLGYRKDGSTYLIVQQEGGSGPQGGSAGDVDALIVTAQKREEAIQDVPIAISAFTQKALEEQKIEGGFDLLKAIPNVTFSKSNFTSYNFSIRGVGTKAISATTDPGVAVAFNNTTLIQNRLFEQEYFDVERVEVLRGPQGTLYGRNATSGVINVISAKPRMNDFEASLKGEVGNYDSRRLVGMVNIPIVDDVLAVRLAAAGTQRTGYDYNSTTRNNVNGRDLWSGRVTIGFEPTERIRANLLWEHFEEDDDRSRTGKQLCHRDPGVQMVGNVPVGSNSNPFMALAGAGTFGQGCQPGSLYDDAAFGAPNGMSMPFILAAVSLMSDCGVNCTPTSWIADINGRPAGILKMADPFAGLTQSRDLRTIASVRDPIYRAKADVYELSVDVDLTDSLTLTSQTAYNKDEVYSFQDYNRFNSLPAFNDTLLMTRPRSDQPSPWRDMAPGGVFCDPQIGCTDRVAGFDISQADGKQFSQELRLSSNFSGPVNFSAGVNYTSFETLVDYYVMYNVLTILTLTPPSFGLTNQVFDRTMCPFSGFYYPFLNIGGGPVPQGDPLANCPYVDPNPLESIDGDGHNYFRSKNPYELESKAAFGEVYWNIDDSLKLTAGLRYTRDEKSFTPVPSQVLLAPGPTLGGTVARGYPARPPIEQSWGEWTGRLGLDWKPDLSFTDETMIYAFYSRGYKGGGANPPTPGFATLDEFIEYVKLADYDYYNSIGFQNALMLGLWPPLRLTAVEYGPTFEPEFVDAVEIGAKSTLLDGAMTLNVTGFYYDYTDYQVSQIRDRTAVNENFDARVWGLEFETVFTPSHNLRVNANLGYLDTRIADGETSIDIMNRTQSNPDYMVVKPWMQLPSNCVVPRAVVEDFLDSTYTYQLNNASNMLCQGLGGFIGSVNVLNPFWDADDYPELNGGAGLRADLGGNELPNAPHWTMNVGAQYGVDVGGSWRMTLRGDAYWQSQSWARVYNAVNDKLHGWYNLNASVRVHNEDLGLEAELYVKNLLDKSPITDAFLNSDDSGLTTNVFVLDPRLVGFSLRKTF